MCHPVFLLKINKPLQLTDIFFGSVLGLKKCRSRTEYFPNILYCDSKSYWLLPGWKVIRNLIFYKFCFIYSPQQLKVKLVAGLKNDILLLSTGARGGSLMLTPPKRSWYLLIVWNTSFYLLSIILMLTNTRVIHCAFSD